MINASNRVDDQRHDRTLMMTGANLDLPVNVGSLLWARTADRDLRQCLNLIEQLQQNMLMKSQTRTKNRWSARLTLKKIVVCTDRSIATGGVSKRRLASGCIETRLYEWSGTIQATISVQLSGGLNVEAKLRLMSRMFFLI